MTTHAWDLGDGAARPRWLTTPPTHRGSVEQRHKAIQDQRWLATDLGSTGVPGEVAAHAPSARSDLGSDTIPLPPRDDRRSTQPAVGHARAQQVGYENSATKGRNGSPTHRFHNAAEIDAAWDQGGLERSRDAVIFEMDPEHVLSSDRPDYDPPETRGLGIDAQHVEARERMTGARKGAADQGRRCAQI